MLDRIKLSRIMELTTSSNENEAMNALRLANNMVKSSGETWTAVLGGEKLKTRNLNEDSYARPGQKPAGSSPFGRPFSDDDIDNIFRNFDPFKHWNK